MTSMRRHGKTRGSTIDRKQSHVASTPVKVKAESAQR